jgi:hypothetical protein
LVSVLNDKLNEQGRDRIYERDGKNTLGRFIAAGIDVKGEQGNIEHQAGNRNSGDLVFVGTYKFQEIYERVGAEPYEIIYNKA